MQILVRPNQRRAPAHGNARQIPLFDSVSPYSTECRIVKII